jgi:Zn-dependent protease with chaperone function
MKWIFISLFFFSYVIAFGQDTIEIFKNDTVLKKQFIQKYLASSKKFDEDLKKKYKGEFKKIITEEYNLFRRQFLKSLRDNAYVFEERFENIISEIKKGLNLNDTIANDLLIVLSRDNSLNAFTLIDGTIICNLGLFKYLQNDDQFASILAHEIGHKLQNHNLKTIYEEFTKYKSKSFKAKLDSIKNKSLESLTDLNRLINKELYEKGHKSRILEFEADSIAISLIKNSKFRPSEIDKMLNRLTDFESMMPIELDSSIYFQAFNLKEQPFKENWLKMEDFSSYKYQNHVEVINPDSIATHPQIKERLEHLHAINKYESEENPKVLPTELFKNLQNFASYQTIPNLFVEEKYGVAIFNCLIQLQLKNDEIINKKWLGKLFQQIYLARKNYTVNRYLDTVNPSEQNKNYNFFLNFMWNLNLKELKIIYEYYCKN